MLRMCVHLFCPIIRHANSIFNAPRYVLAVQGYSKWLSGYNFPAAIPHQIRETTTIWKFHSKVVCTVSRARVRVYPGTEGTNQNCHWNHHRWHATNSLERTRLSSSIQFNENPQIRPVRSELFHADGRTDGRTTITKLIVAFSNFVNSSKKRRTFRLNFLLLTLYLSLTDIM